jgi:Protein of unknown function (DUF3500)
MRRTGALLLSLTIFSAVAVAHDAPTTAQSETVARCAAEMAAAGMNFFNALSPDQQQRAKFAFADDERLNWAFIPKPRKGIPLKEMTPAQRDAAIALFKAGVSQRGFEKADAIMNDLELTLRDIEKSPSRDSGLYFVSLFGEPAPNGTWGWRFEGHHVSFNFTIVDGQTVATAPNFLGANPANVPSGPHKGLRVLAVEEDLARQLVTSLPDDGKKLATISGQAPRDITTSNSRKIKPGAPAGISADKLSADQKKMLRDLISEYANRLRPALAEDDLQKIDSAGFEKVYFAWMGSITPGQGHYYRIQGPTFMIEYDNTQNNANHVHSVWRDPANDFGEDLLKQHYLEHPHEHP